LEYITGGKAGVGATQGSPIGIQLRREDKKKLHVPS
jgi:hypothetical protein